VLHPNYRIVLSKKKKNVTKGKQITDMFNNSSESQRNLVASERSQISKALNYVILVL
jgi:hypothetical protein